MCLLVYSTLLVPYVSNHCTNVQFQGHNTVSLRDSSKCFVQPSHFTDEDIEVQKSKRLAQKVPHRLVSRANSGLKLPSPSVLFLLQYYSLF